MHLPLYIPNDANLLISIQWKQMLRPIIPKKYQCFSRLVCLMILVTCGWCFEVVVILHVVFLVVFMDCMGGVDWGLGVLEVLGFFVAWGVDLVVLGPGHVGLW